MRDYQLFVNLQDEHGIIFSGHGLLPYDVREAVGHEFGDRSFTTEEVFLHQQRAVKWCGKYGDPCDREGETHTHWHQIKPTSNPKYHYTVVKPK